MYIFVSEMHIIEIVPRKKISNLSKSYHFEIITYTITALVGSLLRGRFCVITGTEQGSICFITFRNTADYIPKGYIKSIQIFDGNLTFRLTKYSLLYHFFEETVFFFL